MPRFSSTGLAVDDLALTGRLPVIAQIRDMVFLELKGRE